MNKPTLREQIRSRIVAIGMTQAELSRRTGIPQPNISNYLTGRADMTTATIDRLIKALGGVGTKWDSRPYFVKFLKSRS